MGDNCVSVPSYYREIPSSCLIFAKISPFVHNTTFLSDAQRSDERPETENHLGLRRSLLPQSHCFSGCHGSVSLYTGESLRRPVREKIEVWMLIFPDDHRRPRRDLDPSLLDRHQLHPGQRSLSARHIGTLSAIRSKAYDPAFTYTIHRRNDNLRNRPACCHHPGWKNSTGRRGWWPVDNDVCCDGGPSHSQRKGEGIGGHLGRLGKGPPYTSN